ncbi:MAG TPA: Ig domain-containing protein [Candidatus Sulfotelmatobacter sp.]|nr:Ig domain-containing protein [Candidatus Sulfotelmatobacter sp.]
MAIKTGSLPVANIGATYSASLSASGGQPPYTWIVSGGTLPSGIQLNDRTGALVGTPTVDGHFPFRVGLSDQSRNNVEVNMTLMVNSYSACGPPVYGCARTDTKVSALPDKLPNWGELTGANRRFVDSSFNPKYGVAYTRVTDANTGSILGNANSGFAVGSGSGDDAHFNADETLFTVTDDNAAWYFFGLNRSTMQTGLIWASTSTSNIIWSQSDRNFAYELSNVGPRLHRMDFTGCYLGVPACSPRVTLFYDYTNCGLPSGFGFFVNGGIGGNDRMYAGAIGAQDRDNRIFAYDAATQTCYLYNTRFGIIRSATGTERVIAGTGSCDGTDVFSWLGGTSFGTGSHTWAGANIMLGSKPYQIASVTSSTSLSLGYKCPAGTYRFSTIPGTYVGSISSGDKYSVHDIRMDPAGIWLVIEQGTKCYAGSCDLVHAWQIGTTTVNSCPWTYGGRDPGSCASHYTETASGLINGDGNFANSTNPSMQFRSWTDFSTTNDKLVMELSTVNYSFSVPFDNHPTAKNDPLGTHSYPVFSSTYTPEAAVGIISNAYSNEVMAWKQTSGPPLRFGHTFNSSLSPQFTAQYSIGAVSPLGDFYLYTTDGEGTLGSRDGLNACSVTGGTCRSDVFLMRLTPSPDDSE